MKPRTRTRALKLIEVEWFDATYFGEGTYERDSIAAETLVVMTTVGYVIADRKDALVLAMELSSPGGVRHVSMIPKVNIVRRRTLR